MAVDGVVGEGAKGFLIVFGVEVLEGADAKMAGGDAGEDASHDVSLPGDRRFRRWRRRRGHGWWERRGRASLR